MGSGAEPQPKFNFGHKLLKYYTWWRLF